jgi:hypothetical protein
MTRTKMRTTKTTTKMKARKMTTRRMRMMTTATGPESDCRRTPGPAG